MVSSLLKTLISSATGTTFMTLSSALMSLKGQDFREPKHLSRLAGRLLPFIPKEYHQAIGWTGHYGMGAAFAAVYVSLWEKKKIDTSLLTGVWIGGLSGVVGSLIWKATFKSHPFTPIMNYNRFYLQRIPAHIVFAVFATIAYREIQKYEQRKASEITGSSLANIK